ncbi:protein rapunzel-like [Pimephales promelas]|uniref:protein rapunzel-like n=1 Tax=Pimephales promelas TaxID=90988 RepID=UPI001955D1C8|nr:protein rapunzel-like [Pimephales promelas]XP_039531030.1 protein rapunzel-like [Pimephales promelas]
MSSPLERVVAQKKEAIEAVMEMFERGAEVLASAVGEMCPLFEASAPVLRLVLDNVESKEITYVKDQFLVVRSKLDVLSSQIEDINCEIKKGRLDSEFFAVEENLCNQFRKYIDILEAKPEYKEVRKRLFLQHFPKTGGEKNLYMLYDAVMGNSIFGEPILDVVEQYEARNRRVLEDFCVRLKELLCLGIIALLGYCFLTQGEEAEQEKIQEWSAKIQEIEMKMKEAIEKCVHSFPEQAELDIKRLVKEREDGNLQETAKELLDFLVKKYDWVSWSIRGVSDLGKIRNLRAGQNFQSVAGQNYFEVSEGNDINLVVSFCSAPQPVPNESIRQMMEGPARKGDAKAVVELLEKQLAGFLVHAVSRHKESFAVSSFPEECHYWDKHKNVNVCVHAEEV